MMEGGRRYRKPLTAEEEEVLVASTIFRRIRDIIQNGPSRFSKTGNVVEKIRLLRICLQVR